MPVSVMERWRAGCSSSVPNVGGLHICSAREHRTSVPPRDPTECTRSRQLLGMTLLRSSSPSALGVRSRSRLVSVLDRWECYSKGNRECVRPGRSDLRRRCCRNRADRRRPAPRSSPVAIRIGLARPVLFRQVALAVRSAIQTLNFVRWCRCGTEWSQIPLGRLTRDRIGRGFARRSLMAPQLWNCRGAMSVVDLVLRFPVR